MNRRHAFAFAKAPIPALASLMLLGSPLAAATPDAWIERHRQPLDPAGPIAMPAVFRGAQVMLLGEVHGLRHGQWLDLAMLKAVHAEAGVRRYIGEFDGAQADAFNQALDTADTSALDAVFAGWRLRGLQWANADFRAKLDQIITWNRGLPTNRRIRFVGADEVQDQAGYCRWLAPRLGALPALQARLADPAQCPAALADAGGVSAPAGIDPVTSDALAALAVEGQTRDREARIAANIRRHLQRDGGPVYGLWGLGHVVKAPVNKGAPMALVLAQQGVTVRSLAMLNINGTMMIPTAAAGGGIAWTGMAYSMDSDALVQVNGIDAFARRTQGPLTLFTLRGKATPFRHSDSLTRAGGRLAALQPFTIDASAAIDGLWADGVILSVGSPATRPLG